MSAVDVHQHLWTEPFVDVLAARRTPPRVRRDDAGWRLELAGEPDSLVALDDPETRRALLAEDGVDGALVALSSALGVEGLAPDEAMPLLTAHEEGVAGVGAGFSAWGALGLGELDPAEVDATLERGCIGLSLPSGALDSLAGLERVGPVLERLERHDKPLFVHPGPAPWSPTGPAEPDAPGWWPALADYVPSLHRAWFAFLHRGRRAHRRLRVLFAALAGGAPLHLERLAKRGGPAAVLDRGVFYDTSSYGPRALDAMVRVVGIDQLVHGSDRPVVAPPAPPGPLGDAAWSAITRANPERLLG